MKNLYLVRHGESFENLLRDAVVLSKNTPTEAQILIPKMLGSEWSLTPDGIKQAKKLKQESVNIFPNNLCVYASSFKRAADTAKLVFPENHIEYVHRLVERSTGADHDIVTLPSQKSYGNMWTWKPEGGESLQMVAENRAKPFLKTIKDNQEQNVVVFTHNSIMRVFHATISGFDNDLDFERQVCSSVFRIPNCGVLHYSIDDRPDNVYGLKFEKLLG